MGPITTSIAYYNPCGFWGGVGVAKHTLTHTKTHTHNWVWDYTCPIHMAYTIYGVSYPKPDITQLNMILNKPMKNICNIPKNTTNILTQTRKVHLRSQSSMYEFLIIKVGNLKNQRSWINEQILQFVLMSATIVTLDNWKVRPMNQSCINETIDEKNEMKLRKASVEIFGA